MSVDYRIAPIPTTYRGRRYRSRLEARWAAFFDRLGWAHEYEPYDMGKWSPDFLLGSTVLVEVKPITELDLPVADKVWTACHERGVFGFDSDLRGALIVGISPTRTRYGGIRIGWFFGTRNIDEAYVVSSTEVCLQWKLDPNADVPVATPDLCFEPSPAHFGKLSYATKWFSVFHHECVEWNPSSYPYVDYPDYAMSLWGRATADVQYKAPK